jgi:feruloyl esterase
MHSVRRAALLGCVLLAVASAPQAAQRGGDCAALTSVQDTDLAVLAATAIAPTDAWLPPAQLGAPAPVRVPFCRVEGKLQGRIGFELWLPPQAQWNGRLLGAGVGGDAGVYNFHDLARGVAAGYAAVTNDSGHKAAEAQWMMRPEAVADYTHHSQHLMNQAARRLVAAYYGKAAHHAYFLGCSGGGRQALKEMQRYPGDYDGVVAGAGAPAMPVMSARHLWHALYQQQHPEGALGADDWKTVTDAVLQACDANDGVVDAVVEDPAHCGFDPRTVQCKAGAATACLSPAKVETVRQFYAPLRDEQGQQRDNGLAPGVTTRPGPPSPLLLPLFAQGAHHDPAWQAADFNMVRDLALVDREMPEMRADEADLRAFAARGGRAILYQGWLDPSVVAGQSIDYYRKVQQELGSAASDDVLQLYMVPGMLHCGGGNGVHQFGGASDPLPVAGAERDMLTALTQWVEQGTRPRQLVAARLERGRVVRERPLCPYPEIAKYLGGDPTIASSFRCAKP